MQNFLHLQHPLVRNFTRLSAPGFCFWPVIVSSPPIHLDIKLILPSIPLHFTLHQTLSVILLSLRIIAQCLSTVESPYKRNKNIRTKKSLCIPRLYLFQLASKFIIQIHPAPCCFYTPSHSVQLLNEKYTHSEELYYIAQGWDSLNAAIS